MRRTGAIQAFWTRSSRAPDRCIGTASARSSSPARCRPGRPGCRSWSDATCSRRGEAPAFSRVGVQPDSLETDRALAAKDWGDGVIYVSQAAKALRGGRLPATRRPEPSRRPAGRRLRALQRQWLDFRGEDDPRAGHRAGAGEGSVRRPVIRPAPIASARAGAQVPRARAGLRRCRRNRSRRLCSPEDEAATDSRAIRRRPRCDRRSAMNSRLATPAVSFTHRAEESWMASTIERKRGVSPGSRRDAGRCHFTSRSRPARSIVLGSGVTKIAIARR